MRQIIDQIADSVIAFLEAKAAATNNPVDDIAVRLLKQFKPWLVDRLSEWLESLFGAGNVPPALASLGAKAAKP